MSVRVLAADFAETAALPYEFDAVVCCDLIEHVARPLELLRLLLGKTRPGDCVKERLGMSAGTNGARTCGGE